MKKYKQIGLRRYIPPNQLTEQFIQHLLGHGMMTIWTGINRWEHEAKQDFERLLQIDGQIRKQFLLMLNTHKLDIKQIVIIVHDGFIERPLTVDSVIQMYKFIFFKDLATFKAFLDFAAVSHIMES
jgi:hypothetical protein